MGTRTSRKRGERRPKRSARLLMQTQGSQQVSPQRALGNESAWAMPSATGVAAVVCFAGVAQLVEHLFCKQVVRGSSPRASSRIGGRRGVLRQGELTQSVSKVSESCPSGQREQAVNLPAYAYAGSNPALSTSASTPLRGASASVSCLGELSSPSAEVNSAEPPPQVSGSLPRNAAFAPARSRRAAQRTSLPAGVAQLVERQPSKLNVEGSSPFSRSARSTHSSHEKVTVTPAHLAQLVEHVLGKDEVTSSILVVGSNSATTR